MSQKAVKSDDQRVQDAHWVTRALAGEQQAYRVLFERHRQNAYRLAYRFLGRTDEAADATQESFIKAFRSLERFERRARFSTWLARIVTNTCYDHLRRQKRRPAVSLDALLEDSYTEMPDTRTSNDPERMVLRREQRDFLRAAIKELSPWHKEVVVLVDVMGYDYGEAAALLGLPDRKSVV